MMGDMEHRNRVYFSGLRTAGSVTCKNWYSISRAVSDNDAHRGNMDDRSVRAFAVKPRAFGAPLCGVGA